MKSLVITRHSRKKPEARMAFIRQTGCYDAANLGRMP